MSERQPKPILLKIKNNFCLVRRREARALGLAEGDAAKDRQARSQERDTQRSSVDSDPRES